MGFSYESEQAKRSWFELPGFPQPPPCASFLDDLGLLTPTAFLQPCLSSVPKI